MRRRDHAPGVSPGRSKSRNRWNGDQAMLTLAHLDSLDRRIIEQLQENGRRSNTGIARALGVAEGTIRTRIDRLISDGFIRITAVIDPRKTAYKLDAVIWVRVKRDKARNVGEQIASFPNVVFVAHMAGRYDLVVEALFESDDDLLDFLTRRLPRDIGIVHAESVQVLRTVKINYDLKLPPIVPFEKAHVRSRKETLEEDAVKAQGGRRRPRLRRSQAGGRTPPRPGLVQPT